MTLYTHIDALTEPDEADSWHYRRSLQEDLQAQLAASKSVSAISDSENGEVTSVVLSHHDDVVTNRVKGQEELTRGIILARLSPDDFAD